MRVLVCSFPVLLACGAVTATPPLPDDAFHRDLADGAPVVERVDYNRDIRPILASHCFRCHGFDPSTRKARLRLDVRENATARRRTGVTAIIPGNAADSELVYRVSTDVDFERMPPDGRPSLSAKEIDLLRAWIDQGAAYDQHWSFKPLVEVAAPEVKHEGWPRDDVDRFILARLEANDLEPADDADRPTLLRRLSFDLTGLPPSRDAVERFTTDPSEDAIETVVDELLQSSHYGERWARHWLDLMRYAETYGHEFDYPIRHAWRYRDYVIRAFNEDVPYDDLVREHVAGDLLDPPRMHPEEAYNESLLGTGWWWLSQGTHGPVDVRADEAERIDNQIDVLSKTFLGLTAACARCHDHKFDPITQKDYYGLSGYVQSSRRQEAFLDSNGEIDRAVAELRPYSDAATVALRESLRGIVPDTLRKRAEAAAEVLSGTPRPGDAGAAARDIVYEDFESGDYAGWTVEGTAFGDEPFVRTEGATYPRGVQAPGARFVNTYDTRQSDEGNPDDLTGSLTSEPFPIERPWIRLLVGGGKHPGEACVNLVVDDRIVRSATGSNAHAMREVRWDVAKFIGKSAHIQIVDSVKGGWGHIGVDHIVFSHDPESLDGTARPISTVAAEFGIEDETVVSWVIASRSPCRVLEPVDAATDDTMLATFDDGTFDDWIPDGQAFDGGPTRRGERPGATRQFATEHAAHSGRVSPTLQGALRSPTFEIDRPYIHYRIAGEKCRVRLVIDGYWLDEFNPLLFEGMTFSVDIPSNEGWRWHTQKVLDKYIGHRAYIELLDEGNGWIALDEVRLSDSERSTGASDEMSLGDALVEALEAFNDETADSHQIARVNWLLASDLLDLGPATHDLLKRERALMAKMPRPMRAIAMTDGTPEDEYVFVRGDPHARGEIAPRGFFETLGGMPAPSSASSGRLELAERMLADSNPLPARVIVNRVWHHLFGEPLVPTADDFGALGQSPSHPELLDHLALWFRTEGDWSMKRLVRRLVLTRTYAMSSTASPQGDSIDPGNTLYHRANIRRLQGEAIRDAILAISGRLDRTMYGESVAIHLTEFMQGRGRPGQSGPLDGSGRRSIYLEVRRNFLPPMMLAFDTPVPHTTVGRRNTSNVPAQSLILMNDPFIAGEANRWAERIIGGTEHVNDRIDAAYLEALGRLPSGSERRIARDFLEAAGNDLDAWSDFCHAMFNVKEFIFLR